MKHILFLILISPLFVSCASVNSVSLTSIPSDRSKSVRVVKDKFIVLGFNFDNDFVDTIVEDLKRQCPNGKVTGLLTKDENINYFLYIFWKKQITATGYCVKNGVALDTNFKSNTEEVAYSDSANDGAQL